MSILLLTPDDDFVARVADVLGPTIAVRQADATLLGDDPRYSVPMVLEQEADADVVMIGPGIDPQLALDYAHEFDLQRADMSIVLCATVSADILSEAMRAGVRDVLDPLAADGRIIEVYKHATEAAARARSRQVGEDRKAHDSLVIAVASPKGGSGKTTIATNLAVGLSSVAPSQVAIADLDLQFGDVATALQLMPDVSIADASRSVARLDPMSLKLLLTHHPRDLYALCAPESPVEGERMTAMQTTEIISVLRRSFRYVVMDTTAGLGEHTLAALEAATDIVLICSMDVPGVRSFRTTLQTLDEIGMTTARRHLVLMRADARVGLAIDDIERTIGRPIDVAVPSSRSVPLSMNQGTPILESDQRRNPVTQAMWELTGRFVDIPDRPSGTPRRRRRRG